MIQNAIDKPWVLLAFLVCIVLLGIGAGLRMRHDRRVQRFAHGERRELPRILPDHRWRGGRRKRRNTQ